jgi:hypothetical protein
LSIIRRDRATGYELNHRQNRTSLQASAMGVAHFDDDKPSDLGRNLLIESGLGCGSDGLVGLIEQFGPHSLENPANVKTTLIVVRWHILFQ